MSWKVKDIMSQRVDFVLRLNQGERMSDLCREFGISRKTGYKFSHRYHQLGVGGLFDQSKRPMHSPKRTPPEIVEMVVAMRQRYPTWGPKKLHWKLEKEIEGVSIPAPSTIALILKHKDLVRPRKRKRRATPSPLPLSTSQAPNDIWSIDFKGHFRLGNQRYCYPLTICDHFSRYLLGCEALESTKRHGTVMVLEALFKSYGLPTTMRSDNGAPFASSGLLGLTQLGVYLMRLGIALERIEPGHPEQNGRHERMHLTLKQEATRPASANCLAQQERFDAFVEEYNQERPHEALGMIPPAEHYQASKRPYPQNIKPLEYPLHDIVQNIYADGSMYFPPLKKRLYISTALVGQTIGLRELEKETWQVDFMQTNLGYIDLKTSRLWALETEEKTTSSHEENL